MPDKEWYEVEGAPFPNREAAFEKAEVYAAHNDTPIEVVHVTSTVVRCYRRTVSVTAEDVPPAP